MRKICCIVLWWLRSAKKASQCLSNYTIYCFSFILLSQTFLFLLSQYFVKKNSRWAYEYRIKLGGKEPTVLALDGFEVSAALGRLGTSLGDVSFSSSSPPIKRMKHLQHWINNIFRKEKFLRDNCWIQSPINITVLYNRLIKSLGKKTCKRKYAKYKNPSKLTVLHIRLMRSSHNR